jgi:hypothetical protein
MERMRAASLRLGSQGVKKSFDDHLLIIGDAAGHIDPLTGARAALRGRRVPLRRCPCAGGGSTVSLDPSAAAAHPPTLHPPPHPPTPPPGEGIHTAMMGGKAAAETLLELRAAGDFSAANTSRYERRWKEAYGHDFGMSTAFANLIYRYPIIMDAMVGWGDAGRWVVGRGLGRRGGADGSIGVAWELGSRGGPRARRVGAAAPSPVTPAAATRPCSLPPPPFPPPLSPQASEVKRKGDSMMSKWAEIMTNMQVRGRGRGGAGGGRGHGRSPHAASLAPARAGA